jgi:adenylate cyclase
MERRLAAILAADMVGYSRAMQADEAGTLAALTKFRKDAIEPLVAEHRGRIVKLMGDGVLAEFASVVERLPARLSGKRARRKIRQSLQFRIGVNLGDIVFEMATLADRVNGRAAADAANQADHGHRAWRGAEQARSRFRGSGDQTVKISKGRCVAGASRWTGAVPPATAKSVATRTTNRRSRCCHS